MKSPTAVPNLELYEDIWPTDQDPVIRRLMRSRFSVGGFPPEGEKDRSLSISARMDGNFRWAAVSAGIA